MSYASIMVGMDPGPHASGRAGLAAQLARRFDARLIGVAAWGPDYPRGFGETSVPAWYGVEEIRLAALNELRQAEEVFRLAAAPAERVEWRSEIVESVSFLESQSRAADLVVVGRQGERDHPSPLEAVSPGAALMALGRPVLVVPPGVDRLLASRIVVAWKNTLQSRRAISDAMPLLKRADLVEVLQITDDANQAELDDVVAYLGLHGINATGTIRIPNSAGTAAGILNTAEFSGADLIVSGAFGYSRIRQWFFGGVTRNLLDHSPVCCLMSH